MSITRYCEIPECKKLLEEMCAEWDKYPFRKGFLHDGPTMAKHKEIEARYMPKIKAAAERYKVEHPEEFIDDESKS